MTKLAPLHGPVAPAADSSRPTNSRGDTDDAQYWPGLPRTALHERGLNLSLVSAVGDQAPYAYVEGTFTGRAYVAGSAEWPYDVMS